MIEGDNGVRMFLDMKGSGSLYFSVAGRQAYDLFCREMGRRPDDDASPDFGIEVLFTGVSWFGMDKISGKEAADRILSCEASSESACKKGIRINFSTSGGASICLRIKYDQVKFFAGSRTPNNRYACLTSATAPGLTH